MSTLGVWTRRGIVLGSVAFAASVFGCDDPQPETRDVGGASVDTSLPAAGDEQCEEDGRVLGVLVPEAEVVLVASGFARLQRFDVQVGEEVLAHQVVAEMDVRGDRAEVLVATSALEASEAELERLGLELEQARANRSEVERIEAFISKAELREHRYAVKLAAARRRSADASRSQQHGRMDEVQARIADGKVRAPFAGMIARRYVDAGATLSMGEPVAQLISEARLVRFAVTPSRARGLKIGTKVVVTFRERASEAMGTVITMAPEIDAGTRLVIVEARLAQGALAMLGRLRVGEVGLVSFAEDASPTVGVALQP